MLYHNYFASALGGACAMGTNTMASKQLKFRPAWLFCKCCLSLHSSWSNCNVATCWHVELSKLSLLQLSFDIHASNGFSCPIKFFHLKIATGMPLGESWGVAWTTTEKHWCPASTFACFPGKAFLGTNTMALIQTCQIQAIMPLPQTLSFSAQLTNCNIDPCLHVMDTLWYLGTPCELAYRP